MVNVNVFAVQIYFICFRECLETSIIVSVLLAFIKQTLGPQHDASVYKKLRRQVWWGVGAGLAICLVVGGGIIGAFYGYGVDHFSAAADIWEGAFSLIASIIITVMGAALLRVSKLQDKWRLKISQAVESKDDKSSKLGKRFKRFAEKYAMFFLPFITVLREGLEAVIFIGGVSLSLPATSFPLAVAAGLATGALCGYLIYRGGNMARMQIFLIVSTCFLYLVAAGLFSKGVWSLEINAWNKVIGGDAAQVGSGPGSYDIRQSVWHLNGYNPEINGGGGWGIFNALFGWTNSATYGSVLAYNLYWIVVIVAFLAMRYNEKYDHWPLMKKRTQSISKASVESGSELGDVSQTTDEKKSYQPAVREVGSSSQSSTSDIRTLSM